MVYAPDARSVATTHVINDMLPEKSAPLMLLTGIEPRVGDLPRLWSSNEGAWTVGGLGMPAG